MNLTPEELRLREIFHPFASRKYSDILNRNGRFVHYTSAAVAVNIIKNKQVWMRKSTTMNDFMEIDHGINCLAEAYNGDSGGNSRTSLNVFTPDFVKTFKSVLTLGYRTSG